MKVWKDEYDNNKFIKLNKTYIRSHGGDGTLLKAIHMYSNKKLPFFGTAAGTVNFLMNSKTIISESSKHKKFNLIKINIIYEDNKKQLNKELQAFNEVCIGGDMGSWIDFNVQDKDSIIGNFKGSGIIISTSQGSTGINKNNNGTILPLSSKNWCITGDKTNRKINYIIEPKKTIIHVSSRTPVTVWVDGTNNVIYNVKGIEISKGDEIVIIFNNYDEFKQKRRI